VHPFILSTAPWLVFLTSCHGQGYHNVARPRMWWGRLAQQLGACSAPIVRQGTWWPMSARTARTLWSKGYFSMIHPHMSLLSVTGNYWPPSGNHAAAAPPACPSRCASWG